MADKEEKTEDTKPGTAAEAEAEAEPEAEEAVETEAAEAAELEAAEAEADKPAPKKKARSKKKVAPAEVKVPAVKALADKDAKLSPEVFAVEPKIGVMHEAVRAEMAARRAGTASTKKRGEVRGGGAKPWRQKGTGRARAGSSRMPHWTGGGVAFGPKPRDYSFKVNRKVRAKALRMALSARAGEGSIKIVDGLPFDEPKTKAAAAVLDSLEVTYPLLVLVEEDDVNVALSFRNLPWVSVLAASELTVTDIMGARTLLMPKSVLEQLNSMGGVK